MEKATAIGAVCILIGMGACLIVGETGIACIQLAFLYAYLKITGN